MDEGDVNAGGRAPVRSGLPYYLVLVTRVTQGVLVSFGASHLVACFECYPKNHNVLALPLARGHI